MKKIVVVESLDDKKPTEKELFDGSEALSMMTHNQVLRILQSQKSPEEKLKEILKIKKKSKEVIKEMDEDNLMSEFFTLDWWIKLSESDLEYIWASLFLFDENWDKQGLEENAYVKMLYRDFCNIRWNTLNFRNKNYYFLFDSLKIDEVWITTSINDYEIQELDLDSFRQDVSTHLNRIDQHLKMFLDFFVWMTTYKIIEEFDSFKNDFLKLTSDYVIKKLEIEIEKTKTLSKEEKFNQKIYAQNVELLWLIKKLRSFILHLEKARDTYKDNVDFFPFVEHFIIFLNINIVWFSYIKNIFWIDVDKIFCKYVYSDVEKPFKKIILWLLDAKINIYAFMQNINQILINQNLLNPEFDWDLLIRKDQLDFMYKTSPEAVKRFKQKQQEVIKNHDINRELAIELDTNIWYFCDILIWDKPSSYIHAISLSHPSLKELPEWYDFTRHESFEVVFDLFQELLNTIQDFWKNLDAPKQAKYENELKRNEKRLSVWKTPKGIKPFIPGKDVKFLDIKKLVYKKLIRLQREENHPLVIIKAAQNAFVDIQAKWFDASKEILHILSVNYGWSIVWYYAKHMFEKMQYNWKILINIWNIVYSIYDLKNANDFSKIVDYPFIEIIDEFNTQEMKDFFSSKNRLLIFDDNTSSWRTLNDLRKISHESWFYQSVNIYPCRASTRSDLYDDLVSYETILEFIKNSAMEVRKTRIWKVRKWYKELVSTYIWNTLYKNYFNNK